MTDFKVLAEQTEKVAIGKKNSAGAIDANQWLLFTEMSGITGNNRVTTGPADALFPCQPIHPTPPWAQMAIGQQSFGFRSAPGKFARRMQGKISWTPFFHEPIRRRPSHSFLV
jgi:hypothetical protein